MTIARLLSRAVGLPSNCMPCEPQVHRISFTDGKRSVIYDCNSMACAEVPPEAEIGPEFAGIFNCRLRPAPYSNRAGPLRTLVLNVSHACNLACEYCFARDYPERKIMPVETGLAALDLFPPNAPVNVSFFGGEPMTAWHVVAAVSEAAHALASARRGTCRLNVTTNGTLIDRIRAAAIRRLGMSVLISLDGPMEIHDAARPMSGGGPSAGRGSFDAAMSGLDCLNEAGIVPMARATFAGPNHRIADRLDFFADLHARRKISGVSIEPAVMTEGCATRQVEATDDPLVWEKAADWYIAHVRRMASARAACPEAGQIGLIRPLEVFYFRVHLRRLLNCVHSQSECGAGNGYLTVGPTGEIYACHREEGTHVGAITGGFSAERDAWIDNSIVRHDGCMDCWARYLCGGGCRQTRSQMCGNLHAATPDLCAQRLSLYEQILRMAMELTPDELALIVPPDRPIPRTGQRGRR